ncbi:sensor histidine kinase [Corynebacterium pygosceleis]|uniref:histidine kinase n=1 Tax=Corynebacterium pygosceleis TaxID=2800406 RepID=A0A9Q4C9Z5_9CORY|nr:HAMP domain-containing sensor histidine kinase [Corynebacterium pygosceleis]MCK7638455.1 HAMP domain-containing histidine kinase [Corynebacterium pygosceleis]MCK7675435.1 HAMP domain-containing histidine kinase [Corynebacterium pygosceleis]MCL0121171.1 HAMP domain-containing histidine kinase [Corynebacterium pygosceleis]MCX7469119.1 HAMP domain-containing sensor histidine kinase [Corynebacterium pygosceleis]
MSAAVPGGWRARLPLRVRLIIIVLLMTATGLGLSAVFVTGVMRDYIYVQIDDQLGGALHGWAGRDIPRLDVDGPRLPSVYYLEKIYPDGTTLTFNDSDSAPLIDGVVPGQYPVTVESAPGSAEDIRWRVVADSRDGVTTVVGYSLAVETSMLRSLLFFQLIVGMVVLVAVGGIAQWIVRRALRPLREVETTAVAIAGGDLSRRVPEWPTSTEVGQLAFSLNTMLTRLQQSIDSARRKEEQMRRFVGDASHELRTPLTGVRGFAELYRSGATRDADMVLDRIEQEAGRMGVLVEDLLALTRAEQAPMDPVPVDMRPVCLDVVTSLRAAHPQRTIRVVDTTTETPFVAGDRQRLHRIIVNLVGNALIHGGPDARVTVGLSLKEGSVLVTVADDGVGMSEEDSRHIFGRFYRTDASRSRASGGSGLGLAIVKSLTESHGGTVEVRSAPGEGAVFTVTLPAVSGPPVAEPGH